ncbi:protein HEAT INTOLERANT 4 [Selaginella moellendorffii]|nr:protein HEAT INTOLERANT 4 [Selaginella moellendorffii]|eukprot:XP_002966898.2 protein HEAT INTOLERANT 4 [Selaginella moellendorffii]
MSKKRSRGDADISDEEEDLGAGSSDLLERPSMENIWKEAFPVGTEWDQYDKLYEVNWDFSNLERAFEEGGQLYGKRVYMFGCTEPQLVQFRDNHKVIHIPAVVAVTSPFPPSDKVGIKSVQMEGEMIVPMREMKMDWMPYIPEDVLTHSSLERYKCEIFTLKCTQRRVALRHLKKERIKKYEYCLPYLYRPWREEEKEDDTVVSIMFTMDEGKPPIVTQYDWAFDELEEFTTNLIDEEALPKDEREKFQECIMENVKAEKKRQKEARLARKKAIEEMSEEKKAALENMKLYKFYPVKTDDTPDVENLKSPFINRYYGKADEVH